VIVLGSQNTTIATALRSVTMTVTASVIVTGYLGTVWVWVTVQLRLSDCWWLRRQADHRQLYWWSPITIA
jgi:hypothetical protein